MVSIIVPVYQVEAYLRRCVDSILSQTYEHIQVLLVDDGSTDSSGAICDEYAARDSRVCVIHKKNGGLSDARNVGLDSARGDYVMFVDSDDVIHPETVRFLRNALREYGAEVADAGMGIFSEEPKLEAATGVFRVVDIWERFSMHAGFSVCNRLFPRQAFANIRFPVGRLFEDQFVIFKLLRDKKVVHTDDKLYYYFQRQDSLSKQRVYGETYDLLEAALEVLRDLPAEQLRCRRVFTSVTMERIGQMLGNAYYHDGPYQNCKIETVCRMVRQELPLLEQNATLWQKWMLRRVAGGKGIFLKLLMKSYFHPGKWLKTKLCRLVGAKK